MTNNEVTPLDILGQQFDRRLHGLDPKQVHAFMSEVANTVEALLRERGELKLQLRRLEQDLASFREREGALQDALVAAQKTAERTMEGARSDAQRVVTDAQALADQLVDDANQRAGSIELMISELRSRRREVRAELMRLAELLQGLIRDDQKLELEEDHSSRITLLHRRSDESQHA